MKQGTFEKEIFIQSDAKTVIDIIAVTKVTPKDNGVLLHETITMKAPDLLFGYAFQQAEAPHTEMLKRIKKFVETK